jgi:hypothetical protein
MSPLWCSIDANVRFFCGHFVRASFVFIHIPASIDHNFIFPARPSAWRYWNGVNFEPGMCCAEIFHAGGPFLMGMGATSRLATVDPQNQSRLTYHGINVNINYYVIDK